MLDTRAENFTAEEAIETGLIEALKRGETKITGSYSLSKDGLKINQQKFSFKDSDGFLVIGKFADDEELWKFWLRFSEK